MTRWRIASWRGTQSALAARSWSAGSRRAWWRRTPHPSEPMAAARGPIAATFGRCCTADGRPRRAVRGVVRPFRSRSGCRSPEGARTRLGSAAGCRRAHRRTRRQRARSKTRACLRAVARGDRRQAATSVRSRRSAAPSRPQSRAAGGGACSPWMRCSCPGWSRPCCSRTMTSTWAGRRRKRALR